MNISWNWLRDYITADLTIEEAGRILTDTGLEAESIEKTETVKGGLEGLVIGEVLEKTKHPDADRLSITKVSVGTGEPLQIVCGAANVAAGQKVVVALTGATLYPSEGESFTIKKSKIRGVESNGMICAEDEIGLGNSHEGIMVLDPSAKPGTPASDYFKIETDYCISIGLTPNRIDAASHYGTARDLHAALQQKGISSTLSKPSVNNFKEGDGSLKIAVEIKEKKSCPRYSGITIKNVKVSRSPEWLQNRLKTIGLRPINNIVDVTNFVMHETGQPLHAFDAGKISGEKIIVRKASPGTLFATLDGTERKLTGNELMICDAEKEMCIAGIFGGMHSGVSDGTTCIFLESAYFDPAVTRKSARAHGLNTDSSFRFERGTDISNTVYALKRATLLICELAGGTPGSSVTDVYENPFTPNEILFSWNNFYRLAGKKIPAGEIKKILTSLDFKLLNETEEDTLLQVPLYRVDVAREADVAEEILRIYGYNHIELPGKINASVNHFPSPSFEQVQEAIASLLAARGFSEMMNNSLTASGYVQKEPADTSIRLLNPLSSELDMMRQTLLHSGLETIAWNCNRQQYNLKLFEAGKIYSKSGNTFIEKNCLSVFVTGKAGPENWTSPGHESSFYTIKAVASGILERTGLLEKSKQGASQNPVFEEGLSFTFKNKIIAECGKVKPSLLKTADIRQDVFYTTVDMDALFEAYRDVKVASEEIPKFPVVRRDLSLLIGKNITFAQIEELARTAEKKLLQEIGLFDVYEGKNIGSDKKSYAVSFVLYDHEQTLTDERVEKAMEKIQKTLEEKLGATLR